MNPKAAASGTYNQKRKNKTQIQVLILVHTFIIYAAIALNTFGRSFCAMVFSLASVKMRATLGDGWSS